MSDADTLVRVEQLVIDRLLALAREEAQIECCGLLAGRGGIISTVLPAENSLHSATAYEIAPAELFALLRRMRAMIEAGQVAAAIPLVAAQLSIGLLNAAAMVPA